MSENIDNGIIEHLRHTRGRVDRIAEDMVDVKLRLSSVESAMVMVKREASFGDETDARQQVSIDRLADRLDRIERRLDLIGT